MTPSEREKVIQEAKKLVADTTPHWESKSDDYQDRKIRALYSIVGLLVKVVEDLNVPGHPYRT